MHYVEERRQPAVIAQHSSDDAELARILIVNDDPAVLWSADQALRRAGYRTTTAFDGRDAISADRSHGPFDLLVADLYMPFMSGVETARRLRRRTPGLKAVFLIVPGDQIFPGAIASSDDTFVDQAGGTGDLLAAVEDLLHSGTPPPGGMS